MEEQELKKAKKGNPVTALLSGSILTQDAVIGHLPYLLFISFLALVYIANGYIAESSQRRIDEAHLNIKELRSEQISMKSELNNTIIESELKKIIDQRQLGLTESFDPPKKLVVDRSDLKDIN